MMLTLQSTTFAKGVLVKTISARPETASAQLGDGIQGADTENQECFPNRFRKISSQ